MKRFSITILLVIAVTLIAADYGVYHDSTSGRGTAIFISNLSEEKAYLRVVVYNSKGNELWKNSYRLNLYETILVDLTKQIRPSDNSWGLVLVQSDQLLTISASYIQDDVLFSRDIVMEPAQFSNDAKYYWYSLYYENVGSAMTDLMISNISSTEADVYVWIYDFQGQILKELSGTINPRACAYVSLYDELETEAIGVVDIRSTEPLIIAVEYLEEGESWSIRNIVDWYTTTSW